MKIGKVYYFLWDTKYTYTNYKKKHSSILFKVKKQRQSDKNKEKYGSNESVVLHNTICGKTCNQNKLLGVSLTLKRLGVGLGGLL